MEDLPGENEDQQRLGWGRRVREMGGEMWVYICGPGSEWGSFVSCGKSTSDVCEEGHI